MKAYRFFASYAHADADSDPSLIRFCNQLAETLQRIMQSDEEFFFDVKNIPAGAEWPKTLEDALRTTRSMICFYSPRYFNSRECGREMTALRARLTHYREQYPGRETFGPLGLLWESEVGIKDLIPPVLQDIQYNLPPWEGMAIDRTKALQRKLSAVGLRFILERANAGSAEDKVDLIDIVNCYAQHIKKITETCDLSGSTFDGEYRSLEPEFPRAGAPPVLDPGSSSRYGMGPRFVKVVFLVGKTGAFAGIQERRNLGCYNANDERLWKPYLPTIEDEIVILVNRAVTSEKAVPETILYPTIPDEAQFNNVLQQVRINNNVLVIILDPWSSYVPDFDPSLRLINERRLVNLAVFVPWNDEDDDTRLHAAELLARLNASFEDLQENLNITDVINRSSADLEAQLRAKITRIQSKIVARAAKIGMVRPLPAGSPLPSLSVSSR